MIIVLAFVIGPNMRKWNILATAVPEPGSMHALLGALNSYGEFHATPFKYVCTGWVEDHERFLTALLEASHAGKHWIAHLGRVVPVSCLFNATPESLLGQLKDAAAALVENIGSGTCFVRVERRGMPEAGHSPEIEHALADHVFALVEARSGSLRTSFTDPDYIVVAEILDTECGVGLITRDLRSRFPFVRVR